MKANGAPVSASGYDGFVIALNAATGNAASFGISNSGIQKFGGAGDDVLIGGAGSNTLDGGTGNNVLI